MSTLQAHDPYNGQWNDSLAGDFLWSNVNFGEAVTEAMTPLSWSVIALTLEEWTIVPGYPPAGNIGGLPYLNLSTSASVYGALGRSQESLLADLEAVGYSRLLETLDIPTIPLRRRSLPGILFNAVRMQMGQQRAVRRLPGRLAANPAWCQMMAAQIAAAGTGAGLAALWRDEIETHVRASLPGVLGSASYAAGYANDLRRELTELVGPNDAGALTSSLSSNAAPGGASGQLASLGPLLGLARVARGEMAAGVYLAQYGHRGPDEFELSVPRPAEDPGWLERQVAQFEAAPVDPEAMLARQQAAFESAWGRFRRRYPDQASAWRKRIDQVAPRARLREEARSEFARDRGLVRDFACRAGDLTALGDGVFFLTVAEMLDTLSGERQAVDRIPARRETYRRYKALPTYPSIICGAFDPFHWAADPGRRSDLFAATASGAATAGGAVTAGSAIAAGGAITGAPGSAGRVEGLVRRLDRLEEGDQLQVGEILVTPLTNIGWTFLFPRAAAVVTDVGAPLSHAAIVARELGIPAVVGCGDATARLQTGDRVRVDGGRGVVEIVEPAG